MCEDFVRHINFLMQPFFYHLHVEFPYALSSQKSWKICKPVPCIICQNFCIFKLIIILLRWCLLTLRCFITAEMDDTEELDWKSLPAPDKEVVKKEIKKW